MVVKLVGCAWGVGLWSSVEPQVFCNASTTGPVDYYACWGSHMGTLTTARSSQTHRCPNL